MSAASTKINGTFHVWAAIVMAVVGLACASAAWALDAPSWSGGFPRLVEKNALLQWDPVKGATEYKVYKTETKGKDLKPIASVSVNRYIDKDLPSGKSFYYYVTAVVGGKEGARSEAGAVSTPKEKAFVPLKKPELAGIHEKPGATGKPTLIIRWEGGAGSELVGYNVYRSTKKGADYTLIGSIGGDTYTDEDIRQGTTYYYVVTAVDSNFNETKYSNEMTATVSKPQEYEAAKKEEAPPTKLRATKVLFTIPREKFEENIIEKYKFTSERPPVPVNAQDVKVDEAIGHIYVTSYWYGGILVFDMNGKFQYGLRKDGVNGKDMFSAAENIAVGPNGTLYATDYTSSDLLIFDYQGKPLKPITVDISHVPGREGAKARLYGVAISKEGTIYVGDPGSNRIYEFNERGKRIGEIVRDEKNKDFNGISFMVFDKEGNLNFIDVNHSRIMVVGPDGKFKKTIGKKGMGAGFLSYPVGVANGNEGELFVASGVDPNIQAFGSDGKFMYLLANEKCDGPPPIADIRGIYVDSQDRMYVAEGRMNRVTVLQLLDKYVTQVLKD